MYTTGVQKRGTISLARALHRPASGAPHHFHVSAIHVDGLHTKTPHALCQISTGDGWRTSGDCPASILADENGRQIPESSDGREVRLLSESEIETIAQRDGKFFLFGRLIYDRLNRFSPVSWRDYKGGVEEYFDNRFNEEYRNDWIHNLFAPEAKGRGTLLPLAVIIALTAILVPIVIPAVITGSVKLLSFHHPGQNRYEIQVRSENRL